MTLNEFYTLHNGVQIPKIGFGTWQIPNGEPTFRSVSSALKVGYRHIDTAFVYGNEESVGQAIRASGIARDEIFVTSKLPGHIKKHDEVLASFEQTLQNCGLDHLDLYLIHAPWSFENWGGDAAAENVEAWHAMEEIYKSGRCRAIGVSNFDVHHLTALIDNCEIIPMVNQIKFFIGYTQEEITTFSQEHGILVEGFSPLATGEIMKNQTVAAMAEKYGVSLPQLCVRYVVERGALPLPRSTSEAHLKQNADIEFTIASEDMAFLNGLKNTVEKLYDPGMLKKANR